MDNSADLETSDRIHFTDFTHGTSTISVGSFYYLLEAPLRNSNKPLSSVAEILKLYELQNGDKMVYARLYYRPQDTPDGVTCLHGKVCYNYL